MNINVSLSIRDIKNWILVEQQRVYAGKKFEESRYSGYKITNEHISSVLTVFDQGELQKRN